MGYYLIKLLYIINGWIF